MHWQRDLKLELGHPHWLTLELPLEGTWRLPLEEHPMEGLALGLALGFAPGLALE
jgi:hypothetical protein